jgi:hypothetical protein
MCIDTHIYMSIDAYMHMPYEDAGCSTYLVPDTQKKFVVADVKEDISDSSKNLHTRKSRQDEKQGFEKEHAQMPAKTVYSASQGIMMRCGLCATPNSLVDQWW